MALSGLFCADVPLRNYLLTHSNFAKHSKNYYWQYVAYASF